MNVRVSRIHTNPSNKINVLASAEKLEIGKRFFVTHKIKHSSLGSELQERGPKIWCSIAGLAAKR